MLIEVCIQARLTCLVSYFQKAFVRRACAYIPRGGRRRESKETTTRTCHNKRPNALDIEARIRTCIRTNVSIVSAVACFQPFDASQQPMLVLLLLLLSFFLSVSQLHPYVRTFESISLLLSSLSLPNERADAYTRGMHLISLKKAARGLDQRPPT